MAVVVLSACSSFDQPHLPTPLAQRPVSVVLERAQLATGGDLGNETFACDGLSQAEPPACNRMMAVEGVDWSSLNAPEPTDRARQRVTTAGDLYGSFDGCKLVVQSIKPAGSRRGPAAPKFKPANPFPTAEKAIDVASSVERRDACDGKVRVVLTSGAAGKAVEIDVLWADQATVKALRAQYGPITVSSRLIPA